MIRFKNTDNEYKTGDDYAEENGYYFNTRAHLQYLNKNLGIINNIIYSYKNNDISQTKINSSFVTFRDNFIKEIIELYIYILYKILYKIKIIRENINTLYKEYINDIIILSIKDNKDIDNDTNICINNYNNIINTFNTILTIYKKYDEKFIDKYNILTNNDNNMNKELLLLNNTINKYNIELKKYTNSIWYYRKIIIFGFILLMIIIIIFNIKSIDKYIKALILLFILLIIIIYYKNNIIQEDFTVCLDKSKNYHENSYYNINKYYIALDKYLYYIKNISSYDNDILNNNTLKNLMNKITIIKQNKKELYKLKTMSLESSIDLFNKTINSYYYHTVCVIFNIFIIFISAILYLLLPNIIIFIIILIVISIIISIYYTQYNIHRTTRIDEKKYYWAYLNPSKIILDLL